MDSMRREVLKSIAAASVAVPAAATAHTGLAAAQHTADGASAAGRRVLPVVSGQALDAAFVHGAGRAARRAAATLLPAHTIGEPQTLAALPRTAAGRPTALVGLTDTATAMLVLDRVRSAGGAVLAMTHHRLAGETGAAAWAEGLGELAVAQAHSQPALLAGAADDGAAGAARLPGGVSYMSFTCII
ncbi:hypothetical protein [Thauera linaloolentis]|nr:hypothetical protein [Thauera linaloolentis]MCM8566780.1 hypothetical protein [Thauera linaloolentis]